MVAADHAMIGLSVFQPTHRRTSGLFRNANFIVESLQSHVTG
jgi:hypothetical protein